MVRNSDRAWTKWAESDPYFAVLTSEDYRGQNIDANRDKFFSAGETYISDTIELLLRHFPDMTFGRALDFGCGVGRLTLPLARRFEEVVGIDVAPPMLREAEANAAAMGINNARFALSDDQLSGAGQDLDYVGSCIVLQHIPVDRGMRYMDRMLTLLRPGGVANLHFTIRRDDGLIKRAIYAARMGIPLTNNLVNLLQGRKFGEPMMQMNEYPFGEVLDLFASHGIRTPIILSAPQESTQAVYLIGGKPTG